MPKILDIITNPSPILRKKSKEVEKKIIRSKKFQELILDMGETMIKKDGVGLAAPQIGKNIRVIVINNENGIIAMINPIITKKSWAKESDQEGCLSIPNVFGKVRRHKKINCIYINDQGAKTKVEAGGMTARVIQHEIDHLDGILFIDTAKNLKEVMLPIT